MTGSLKLAFDASESADSDGQIERFEWDFGDGHTGEGEQVEHTYDEEKGYTVKLTIEDDGGNEVSTTIEIVAMKGILTTGAKPIDFIGVDKHLRCSVIRDGALFAEGSGYCGTFVALDGKTYGPPELIDGTTDLHARQPGALQRRRHDDARDGRRARRDRREGAPDRRLRGRQGLVPDRRRAAQRGAAAAVYRAARCAMARLALDARRGHGDGRLRRRADARFTGCRCRPEREHDAGDADGDPRPRSRPAQPLADTCACGAQDDPVAAIGWPVAPTQAPRLGSLAAFGPDGSIPLTFDIKADKTEVQPLDDNAFTVTLHNPNAGEQGVRELVVAHEAAWDHDPRLDHRPDDGQPGRRG